MVKLYVSSIENKPMGCPVNPIFVSRGNYCCTLHATNSMREIFDSPIFGTDIFLIVTLMFPKGKQG